MRIFVLGKLYVLLVLGKDSIENVKDNKNCLDKKAKKITNGNFGKVLHIEVRYCTNRKRSCCHSESLNIKKIGFVTKILNVLV